MSGGIPSLTPAQVLRFAVDPFGGMLAAQRAHGATVSVGYASQRTVFLFGPEANSFVFARPEIFSWRESFAVMLPVLGETALLVTDGEDHRRRRHHVLPAFHRGRIDAYVRLMSANTIESVQSWCTGSRAETTLDLYRVLRSVVRRNTVEALYGNRLAADSEVIGDRLQIALNSTDLPLGAQLFLVGVPNPLTARGKRARRKVAARVQAEIDRRRLMGGPEPDGLGALLSARSAESRPLNDAEVRDQVISLIVAGYETTSAALAWTLYASLRAPDVWERARKEVDTVLRDSEISAELLEQLPYVDAIVQESLRLHPPVVVLPRVLAEDAEFGGHRLRAGSRLAISPYVTHRMPEVWPEPERFHPGRWDPEDPLHRPTSPSVFLPFGGGRHRCIGAPFATAELKTILAELIRSVDLRLLADVAPASIMAMRPRKGLPVAVRRRT